MLYRPSSQTQGMTHTVWLIRYDAFFMTHYLVWITIQIPYIRSPIFGLYRLFGQENVNFHNFMVGFDGWMCHNGPTSSTTSKLHPLRRRVCAMCTILKKHFSSIWSNQKSKECCKRRKSKRTKSDSVMTHDQRWLIPFAVMWPNPNFNFYTLQHVDFNKNTSKCFVKKNHKNSHFITESILKMPKIRDHRTVIRNFYVPNHGRFLWWE